MYDMNVLLACVNSYCQWAGAKINMGKTEVTGYDYKRQCPLDLRILQLGNGKPKIVMLWDPIKYLGVRLTITGDWTFERYNVRKKALDTIKQLTKHMYQPQQIHWVVQVAITAIQERSVETCFARPRRCAIGPRVPVCASGRREPPVLNGH